MGRDRGSEAETRDPPSQAARAGWSQVPALGWVCAQREATGPAGVPQLRVRSEGLVPELGKVSGGEQEMKQLKDFCFLSSGCP